MERIATVSGTTNLLDILDRVLDKGLVIAGDVRISLANVELLTIRIRLLVCSVDKAEQIGLDWWRTEAHFSGGSRKLLQENADLREQVALLEKRLAQIEAASAPTDAPPQNPGRRRRQR